MTQNDKAISLLERAENLIPILPMHARELCLEALALAPEDVDVMNCTGRANRELFNYKEAISWYKKAIKTGAAQLNIPEEITKVKPEMRETWWYDMHSRPYMSAICGLAFVYIGSGNWKEARRLFNKLLKLQENDSLGVRYWVGVTYHHEGDLEKAIKYYLKYPEDPHVKFNLMLAYLGTNQYRKATIAFLDAMFSRDGNFYIPRYLLKMGVQEYHGIYLGTSLRESWYAWDYYCYHSNLWREEDLNWLRNYYTSGILQRLLGDALGLLQALNSEKDFNERGNIINEYNEIFNEDQYQKLADESFRAEDF